MANSKKNNGWIIAGTVVVVVVIVLVALLSVGFKSGSSGPPINSCVSSAGFTCTYPVLHNGTLTASVSQNTGATWTQANIFVVISGSPNPTAVPPLPCEQGISTTTASGQQVNVSLSSYSSSNTCAGFPTAVGTGFVGGIWAGYRTSLNGTEQLVQVGTVTMAAT